MWADDEDSEGSGAKFSAEAAATFNKRCTACHTFGKGVKVGIGSNYQEDLQVSKRPYVVLTSIETSR